MFIAPLNYGRSFVIKNRIFADTYGVIIGLVLLGLVIVLLFFGIAQRVFKSFGIAYWLAFIIVGALVGSAFIPSFSIGGVTVNVAGFIAPVVLAVVFFVLSGKTREAGHSTVAASAVLAVYVSVRLLLNIVAGDTVVSITAGVLCGATAFIVGKTKLAALSGVFLGVPLGVVASTVVERISYGTPIRLGSPAVFDVVVLAAVFSVVVFEIVAAVKRASNAKRSVAAETAEEFDPEEYKKYFDE